MGTMKTITGKYAALLNGRLHRALDSLPPGMRLWLVLAAFSLFAAFSLYLTVTAFAEFGKGKGGVMEIRHIGSPDLPVQKSDNLYNNVYGSEKRKEE